MSVISQPTSPLGLHEVRRARRQAVLAWILRCGPAEIAGTLGAVASAHVAARSGVAGFAAIAAFLGEAVTFYGVIVLRDLRQARGSGRPRRLVLRRILVEFGPAEALDWLTRPLLMYVAILATNAEIGALTGKVAADAVFWLVAVMGYRRARRP